MWLLLYENNIFLFFFASQFKFHIISPPFPSLLVFFVAKCHISIRCREFLREGGILLRGEISFLFFCSTTKGKCELVCQKFSWNRVASTRTFRRAILSQTGEKRLIFTSYEMTTKPSISVYFLVKTMEGEVDPGTQSFYFNSFTDQHNHFDTYSRYFDWMNVLLRLNAHYYYQSYSTSYLYPFTQSWLFQGNCILAFDIQNQTCSDYWDDTALIMRQ